VSNSEHGRTISAALIWFLKLSGITLKWLFAGFS